MKSYMNAFSLYRHNMPLTDTDFWRKLMDCVQPAGLSQAHLAAWRQEFWGCQVVPEVLYVDDYSRHSRTSARATVFEELNQQPMATRGSHAYIRSHGSPLVKLGSLMHATNRGQYIMLGWAAEDGSETGAQEFGSENRHLSLPKPNERTAERLRLALSTHLREGT